MMAVVILGIILLVFVIRMLNPAGSSEFHALKKASSIAFYIDSLSTVDKGFAVVELDGNFSVELEIVDDNLFETAYKNALFFINFKEEGYYVKVTPQKAGSEGKASSVFILTYPKEDEALKRDFGIQKTICIKKEQEKRLAEVFAC